MFDPPAEQGQSTVEMALCLPLVALLLAVIVQVGLITSDNGRLWLAAREGVRLAAVDGDRDRIEAAVRSSGLAGVEVEVHPDAGGRAQGHPVTVEVAYTPRRTVPLVGRLFGGVTLQASATMRIEAP